MQDGLSARLIGAARALLPRAAARYSGFRVAAALEDASGEVHPGVNVESVSYGLSICAERSAASWMRWRKPTRSATRARSRTSRSR